MTKSRDSILCSNWLVKVIILSGVLWIYNKYLNKIKLNEPELENISQNDNEECNKEDELFSLFNIKYNGC